jgi:hypothetical protein
VTPGIVSPLSNALQRWAWDSHAWRWTGASNPRPDGLIQALRGPNRPGATPLQPVHPDSLDYALPALAE